MGRSQYEYENQADCRGGINEEPEGAQPNQVLDARNMWCRDGVVQQRPGYTGSALIVDIANDTKSGDASFTRTVEDNTDPAAPLYGASYDAAVAKTAIRTPGDRLYFGIDSAPEHIVMNSSVVVDNTGDTQYKAEYYNGTEWVHINVPQIGGLNHKELPWLFDTTTWTGNGNAWYTAPAPGDWASTTIDGNDLYWLRFELLDNDFSGTVTLDDMTWEDLDDSTLSVRGAHSAQFPSTKRYLFLRINKTSDKTTYFNMGSLNWSDSVQLALTGSEVGEPSSVTVVPQFEEAYMAYNHTVTVHKAHPETTDDIVARVEDRPEWVGTMFGEKSPFHPDYVIQDSSWPRAKYQAFYHGQLWAAGLLDDPYAIKWSASQPAYKVWPKISYEMIMEDDNSPITGMRVLGEQLIVFKQDSIWSMQWTGVDGVGLNSYKPNKLVSGIGCVSNSSIAAVNGWLYFLSEDGVYAINGAPNKVEKISGPIDNTISTISPGRRPFATGVHWRRENVYMLSVSVGGAGANNRVLVYDYTTGGWWVWDSIEAESWLNDEGEYDDQEIYFGDSSGNIFKFGEGDTDHGSTITSYIQYHRVAFGDFTTKTLREVRVNAYSDIDGSITAAVTKEDDDQNAVSKSIVMTDTVETKLGSIVLGTSKLYVAKRRERKMPFRVGGEYFTLKLTNSNKNQRIRILRASTGTIKHGLR